jgi:hypothetical protein
MGTAEPAITNSSASPTWYEIQVEGCLTPQWAEWFEGLSIAQQDDRTLLTGLVLDQAALHGLLRKVRDLGMPLISVTRLLDPQTQSQCSRKEQKK